MESLLWMLDLVGVVYLCYWALREDRREQDEEKAGLGDAGMRTNGMHTNGMRKAGLRPGKD